MVPNNTWRSLCSSLKRIDSELILHLALIRDDSVPSCLACEPWVDECTALGRSGFGPCAGLRRLVREEKPIVCHLHLYSSTLAAVIAIKNAGAGSRLFATFHSPISQWSWRHRFAFRVAVSMCDTVIGASAFTAGELRKWREDVVTAPPPVDVGRAASRD